MDRSTSHTALQRALLWCLLAGCLAGQTALPAAASPRYTRFSPRTHRKLLQLPSLDKTIATVISWQPPQPPPPRPPPAPPRPPLPPSPPPSPPPPPPVTCDKPFSFPWSGLCWFSRTGEGGPCGSPGAPCNNTFTAQNVEIDEEGRLVLWVRKDAAGKWTCGEVLSTEGLGYGTYYWRVDFNPGWNDKHLIASPFVFQDTEHEWDIEFSTWSGRRQENTQFVIQPPFDSIDGFNRTNRVGFNLHTINSLHRVTWKPGLLSYVAFVDGMAVAQHRYIGERTRAWVPGKERVHINYWMDGGKAPEADSPFRVRCFWWCAEGGKYCRGRQC